MPAPHESFADSRRSSDVLHAEREALCAVIVAHSEELRTASRGRSFEIDGASFELFGKARNTIYRVSKTTDWFLKLPRAPRSPALLHERAGAIAIDDTLARLAPAYRGAAVTHVDVDNGFVLASRIPGRPLNRTFLVQSWIPRWLPGGSSLEGAFETLGSMVATVHLHAPVMLDAVAATTRPFETVKGLLDAATDRDRLVERVAEWYDHEKRPDGGDNFIHGNLRMDNVLCDRPYLGLLDFENSGTGSPYQDLSRPVAELLLTRSLLLFPRNRVDRYVVRFLTGYRQVRTFEPAELWAFVRARVCRYYLETRAKGPLDARIGGVPISRGLLNRVTSDVLERHVTEVIRGVESACR